jgi:hypothetical protein
LSCLREGGLAQISSLPGGSRTRFALSCLASWLAPHEEAPSSYSLFISDEGLLYPPAVVTQWKIPLAHLLLVKARDAPEVWRAGLEGVQTGLFAWIFLRPSRGCEAAHLRRLQLGAERTRTRVCLLTQARLPHWMMKARFEVENESTAHSAPPQPLPIEIFGRGLSRSHA